MPVPKRDRNRVDLVGEVARPPVLRRFDSGAVLLSFQVRTRLAGESTDNVPISWWEPFAPDLTEGARVRVQGRVRRRFFTGTAGLRSAVEVVAESVEIS